MDSLILGDDLPSSFENYKFDPTIYPQTSTSPTTHEVHADNSMHQTIVSTNYPSVVNDGHSAASDITKFLERKVKIATYTWGVGTDFSQNLQPWQLLLSNAAVARKLQNYHLFKANMKLTFYMNGTPFHMGMILASYRYLNKPNETVIIGGDSQLVTRSQRPHIFMNVSTNKNGCLCVPFFSPANYLALTSKTFSATEIGTLNIDSFAPLRQINAGTDNVTITVFAELEDVILAAPTSNLVALSGLLPDFIFEFEPQSKNSNKSEHEEEGIISKPASAIADMAGKLTSFPVIGPFALATQMGAGAVSDIAKLFGFSKPIQLKDVTPMRNYPVSSLSLCEGADTSQKLTLTGKQELTIDPRTVQLPPSDDLSIKSFTSRESYITKFGWDVTDLVDSTVFCIDVDPMAEHRTDLAGGSRYIPTSLSYVSRPFDSWSGTLKYRFQVVASQYHRGRISVIYDPTGPLSAPDVYNTTFNTIIDLDEGRDFTIEVGWQQDLPYLSIDGQDPTRLFYAAGAAPQNKTAARSFANGILYVRVVNELVTPDATSGVEVIVSISAGDDFELVNPNGVSIDSLHHYVPLSCSIPNFDFEFQPQSSALETTPDTENAPEQEQETIQVTQEVSSSPECKSLAFYGERVTSVRQLLKRYCFWRNLAANNPTVALSRNMFLLKQMPASGGYDPNGLDLTSGAEPYTFCPTGYIEYFKRSFAGWRGSVRYKFLPKFGSTHSISVCRRSSSSLRSETANGSPIQTIFPNTVSKSTAAFNGLLSRQHSSAGMAITQNRSQDALEVEIPYSLPIRCSATLGEYYNSNLNTLANAYPGGDAFDLVVYMQAGQATQVIETYVAAGEDFTLFGFIGAPTLYFNSTPLPS